MSRHVHHAPPGTSRCPCKATSAPARLRVCMHRLVALRIGLAALNRALAPVKRRKRVA